MHKPIDIDDVIGLWRVDTQRASSGLNHGGWINIASDRIETRGFDSIVMDRVYDDGVEISRNKDGICVYGRSYVMAESIWITFIESPDGCVAALHGIDVMAWQLEIPVHKHC